MSSSPRWWNTSALDTGLAVMPWSDCRHHRRGHDGVSVHRQHADANRRCGAAQGLLDANDLGLAVREQAGDASYRQLHPE
jgi:hypothetical protein